MKSRLSRLACGARGGSHSRIPARAAAAFHCTERSEMLTAFLLVGSWSSRARFGRLPLALNRWGQFSAARGPSLLRELQMFDRKPAPAAITVASRQESSAFRSVIRRLRGEAQKPR
jgi:hypothetical protein